MPYLASLTGAGIRLVLVSALIIGLIGALGGLVLYWLASHEIEFALNGYRIRRGRGATAWVYEELSDAGVRGLPFVRVVVAAGYPCTSEVLLPDAQSWDERVPMWAQGRRAAIVERVLEQAGRSVTRLKDA